jgi:hypothetical protein
MLGRLRALLGSAAAGEGEAPRPAAPGQVAAPGGATFDFLAHLERASAFPIARWEAIAAWVESLPDGEQAKAWGRCERAWMLHMAEALGPGFALREGATAMVLSSLDAKNARHALEFMERTLRRIVHVLAGVAQAAPWGKDLLILFDDADTYYQYASIYQPDGGEFALSSGMHITRGCSHFISTKAELGVIEPVIAHEMTHGCVAHLPLPLWLNEGLAVNTEHRVAGTGQALHTPEQMRMRHLKFWGAAEVQEFWSGRSFRRHDDGNELSYDLARILVESLSSPWEPFAAFVRDASYGDAGMAAAREHLAIDLGEAVAALLEVGEGEPFAPRPGSWPDPAEHVPERT